jgi:23S rRNA (cytidine1920-2'-O)/16S rRNA (cytidine1409-2'-O)-methyltransferase
LEKTNARYLTGEQLGETVDLIVMDVSFISAALVLPAVFRSAFPEAPSDRQGRHSVILVKPQFEVGRRLVGKGGIVRDVAAQTSAVERIREAVISLKCAHTDVIESPILGAEGNREFLLYAKF